MDTQTVERGNEPISETEQTLPAEAGMPGTLNGAEMIRRWEQAGVFDVWEDRKALIGPDKPYADSAEYVHALRQQTPLRGQH